jgi:hypothetical protein
MNEQGTHRSTDLAGALRELALTLRKPSIVFILSDFLCPSFETELRTLSTIHDVVLVQIESPLKEGEALGLVTFTDAESGEQVVVDTSSAVVRTKWNEALEAQRLRLRDTAQSCRADHIVISDSVIRPLVRLMRERTRRIAR